MLLNGFSKSGLWSKAVVCLCCLCKMIFSKEVLEFDWIWTWFYCWKPLWPGKGKVQLRVQLNKLSYIIAADHLLDKKNSSLVIRPPSSHSWLSKRKIDLLEGPFGHILLAIFSFVWLAPSLKIFFHGTSIDKSWDSFPFGTKCIFLLGVCCQINFFFLLNIWWRVEPKHFWKHFVHTNR